MLDQIFYDPSNRRWPRIKVVLAILGSLALVTASLFVTSLWLVPNLPQLPELASVIRVVPRLPDRQWKLRRFLANKAENQLMRDIEREKPRARTSSEVVAAFYAPWQPTALNSLIAQASNLTEILPVWLRVAPSGDRIDFTDWNPAAAPTNLDVIRIARSKGIEIHPVISNAHDGLFDPARVHRLLENGAHQRRIAEELRVWLVQNRFQGLNVDFENLEESDYRLLPGFLGILKQTLGRSGLELSVDLEPEVMGLDWSRVSGHVDAAIVMAYNEHSMDSEPGPISSMSYFRTSLERGLREIDRDKLVMGVANYAYDWTENETGAEALTYQQALFTAAQNHSKTAEEELIDFDPEALNPTFNYVDGDQQAHEVWMLDAVTAANQWTVARRAGVRGAAVWALGLEDPSIWSVLRRESIAKPFDIRVLTNVTFPYAVEYIGEGELLDVVATPQAGTRELDVDPLLEICLDERYLSLPTGFVIRRHGVVDRGVALTIDDGPAEPYTSQILDILKRYDVKASFFLIGENATKYPDLVKRIWAEGHDIGNHTYTHANIGQVSETRARLEINATQRVFQSLLGRSTTLFRPPYNADAEPRTLEEVRPVVLASKMGYVTVGELVDPVDWALRLRTPEGVVRNRTAEELASSIVSQIRAARGSGVLLHDGGGDRSLTVKALEIVIPQLLARGYHFVTISQMAGTTRDVVMPPVGKTDAYLLGDDRVVFESLYYLESFAVILFIAAVIIGILRVVMMTLLALVQRRRDRLRQFQDDYSPTVTVLIAAFNEERVISRTLEAVLRSTYRKLDIIVIDDGSSDGTAAMVAELTGLAGSGSLNDLNFAGSRGLTGRPPITLIRQSNAGKAAALNRGILHARGELLVCLDADTLFEPSTIGNLVRHFEDPSVGAVAGNVKVGNRLNAATIWQSIEYITSQNLDRQAYATMNCVTVVPGAVGAWRKTAVAAAGGYASDTMAEDMDLTWRVRLQGWKVGTERQALARTEAPDTLRSLFKQRFRWAFGTLQCLWKYRSALGRHGFFGRLMLPSLWLFQIVFQLISPIIDFQIAVALLSVLWSLVVSGVTLQYWHPDPSALESLQKIGAMYLLFLVVESLGGVVAFHLDGEKKRYLLWLTVQRFFYRQLMYAVVWKSIKTALHGIRAGWGKLERKGSVELADQALDPAVADVIPI